MTPVKVETTMGAAIELRSVREMQLVREFIGDAAHMLYQWSEQADERGEEDAGESLHTASVSLVRTANELEKLIVAEKKRRGDEEPTVAWLRECWACGVEG